MRKLQMILTMLLLLVIVPGALQAQLPTKRVLTLNLTKKIAAAAEAEALRRGATVVIAVVDDGGYAPQQSFAGQAKSLRIRLKMDVSRHWVFPERRPYKEESRLSLKAKSSVQSVLAEIHHRKMKISQKSELLRLRLQFKERANEYSKAISSLADH